MGKKAKLRKEIASLRADLKSRESQLAIVAFEPDSEKAHAIRLALKMEMFQNKMVLFGSTSSNAEGLIPQIKNA